MDAVCFTVSTYPAARVHSRSLLPLSSLVAERSGKSLAAALQPDPAVPASPGTCKLSVCSIIERGVGAAPVSGRWVSESAGDSILSVCRDVLGAEASTCGSGWEWAGVRAQVEGGRARGPQFVECRG